MPGAGHRDRGHAARRDGQEPRPPRRAGDGGPHPAPRPDAVEPDRPSGLGAVAWRTARGGMPTGESWFDPLPGKRVSDGFSGAASAAPAVELLTHKGLII